MVVLVLEQGMVAPSVYAVGSATLLSSMGGDCPIFQWNAQAADSGGICGKVICGSLWQEMKRAQSLLVAVAWCFSLGRDSEGQMEGFQDREEVCHVCWVWWVW